VKRACFDDAGGFDEALRQAKADDIVLGWRLVRAGHRVELARDLRAKHLKRYTVLSYCREYYRHTVEHLKAAAIYRPRNGATWRFRMGYSTARRWNVVLVAAALLAAPAALYASILWGNPIPLLLLPPLLLALLGATNLGLLRYLRRHKGTPFAFACLLVVALWAAFNVVAVIHGTAAVLLGRPGGSTP